MDNQVQKSERFRHFFQVLWAVFTNCYLIGLVRGNIYQGKIKNICVPGMNCYSCPGAVAACPIGALQATIGSYEYKFAFYVAGFMILVGTFMGRFVCGWLCPFCKYICPLGAMYSLFNPVSILRYRVDSEKCVNCGACAKACKMGQKRSLSDVARVIREQERYYRSCSLLGRITCLVS